MTTSDAEFRARVRQFLPPLTMIVVCLPLVLRLVPRNRLYGFRVREAMQSDASWYAVNQLGGVVLIVAALIWLAAAGYAPRRFVKAIGVIVVGLALLLLMLTQEWTL